MAQLFDSSAYEENALFILGNGFDLFHSIKSSYSDFENYVRNQGNIRLINLMDIFFSNENELWEEVETALGEYDEEAILNFCKPAEGIDYDHMMRSVAAIEDGPDWIFNQILEEFIESFHNWVDDIDIKDAIPCLNLPSKSHYLTFNYTETLEHVYGIPQSKVMHIHGSRLDPNKGYIVGHNNWRDPATHDTLHGELYFEQETKNKIIAWMNKLRKNTECIINLHKDFFHQLLNVSTIVEFGHSLNEVDWPYFIEIAKNVRSDAHWTFYYYDRKDYKNIQAFITATQLKNVTLKTKN